MKSIFGHKLTQYITALFIFLSVVLIMYPPDIEFFKKTSEFAVHLMFGLLFLSFVFLVFNQTRLMFISMLASGFLAFYLKTASNTDMTLPKRNLSPEIKVAHFNASSFDKSDTAFINGLVNSNFDVISFQEYTPDWDPILSRSLSQKFHHSHKMVRIDLFGMAIFSKKKIYAVETFNFKDIIPNINLLISNERQYINVISSYISPPSMESTNISSKGHLDFLADYISSLKNPTLVMGEFNQVYWTNDIKSFRDKSNLKNSRRQISLTSKIPYDHIFYSEELQCTNFEEITNQRTEHLGIVGTFQTSLAYAKKE